MKLEDLKERLDKIQGTLKRIEFAIFGDEAAGQSGIGKQQALQATNHEALKERVDKLERWKVYLIGAGAGLVLVYKFVIDWSRSKGE